jgi:hypothetical protein
MPSSSPSSQGSIRPPHPLATRLIECLRNRIACHPKDYTESHPGEIHSDAFNNIRVLEIGTGNGRNTAIFTTAGFIYAGISDDDINTIIPHVIPSEASSDAQSRDRRKLFHAALATHSLLHGTPAQIMRLLDAIAAQLEPNGLLYATLGSTRDARFGEGEKLGERTFAALEGDERGVPHSYFDEPSLRELLNKNFVIERIEEIQVDAIAGSWAHSETPLRGAFHWFVEATLLGCRGDSNEILHRT